LASRASSPIGNCQLLAIRASRFDAVGRKKNLHRNVVRRQSSNPSLKGGPAQVPEQDFHNCSDESEPGLSVPANSGS